MGLQIALGMVLFHVTQSILVAALTLVVRDLAQPRFHLEFGDLISFAGLMISTLSRRT
jgi:hypothetical protein